MTFEILKSSDKAAAIATDEKAKGKKALYPFDELNVGMSFSAKAADVNVNSLKTLAYRKSKHDNKHFVVVEHPELIPPLVEVARLK